MEQEIKPGNTVVRKSHGKDIIFKVVEIDEAKGTVLLRGKNVRLMADAPVDDLELYSTLQQTRRENLKKLIFADYHRRKKKENITKKKRWIDNKYSKIKGTVLHLDGDKEYLERCMNKYDELKIEAYGYHINEDQQSSKVQELLKKHQPDVLVITGHDGLKGSGNKELSNYYNSRSFIETVERARDLEVDRDSLVIFAGACQSYYELLIKAGANYASSPERVNIHTLDPVTIAEIIVITSIKNIVSIEDVIDNSITGIKGIGGIESRGKMRLSLPKLT